MEHVQLAVRHRDGVGSSLASVQQRDLAEYVALTEHIVHAVLAVLEGSADLHCSRSDGARAAPRITLGEYVCAALHHHGDDTSAEAIDLLRSEPPEEMMISQHGALVGITGFD